MKIAKTFTLISILSCVFTFTSAGEIGLQLHSMRHQMADDLPDAMSTINSWGIRSVEGGGVLYDQSVNSFKALLDEHQLDIVSVDTNYEEVRDNPMAVVYKAQAFGARYATVYWIPHDGKTFSIEIANEAVEVFNRAGAILKKNGITLQYHPHGYEFLPYMDGTILDYMLNTVTEAKFQMDVFWIKQGGGNPVEILKKHKGKFTSLHLKDRRHGSPNSSDGTADKETNVVLGTGDVGIGDVVEEAKKQGIQYFFIEDESKRVVLQVPESIKYLKSLNY